MAKRKKTVQAGPYVRTILYTAPEPRDGARMRAEKSKITTEARQIMNRRISMNNLKARIYGNFGPNAKFVSLSYRPSDLPAKWGAAVKCVSRYVDAIRRNWRKKGKEPKYIYTTENKHGDGRFHHHMIINATDEEMAQLRALWAYGDQVDIQPLSKYGLAYGEVLAEYMMKERKPVGARAWTGSLNLIKPAVQSEFVHTSTTLAPPPGAYILANECKANEYGGYWYLEYILPGMWTGPEKGRKRHRNGDCSQAVLGL